MEILRVLDMVTQMRLRGGLLAVAAVVLCSCYESEFVLGPVSEGTIDLRLVGSWRCVSAEESENKPILITVRPFDEKQYYVGLASEGEEAFHYRAYSTSVNGTTLHNVQALGPHKNPAERTWIFVRASLLKPDVLQLEIVRDGPFKGIEPAARTVREIVERLHQSPELYQEYCVCARVTEKSK